MVRLQIEGRGIRDPAVLAAMRSVKRHLFAPSHAPQRAYGDHPLPIGRGQTISQPYVVAFMTDALRLHPRCRVLEVGTGSGYQAAVLAELVAEVKTIEIVGELATAAKRRLIALGYRNVEVRHGDGYQGWAASAPFDRILLTAAPAAIPQPLLDQLAVGGVLVAPVGEDLQKIVRIERTAKGYRQQELLDVRFVPMTGRAQHQAPPPVTPR